MDYKLAIVGAAVDGLQVGSTVGATVDEIGATVVGAAVDRLQVC